jgi:Fe2+ transport system protein B
MSNNVVKTLKQKIKARQTQSKEIKELKEEIKKELKKEKEEKKKNEEGEVEGEDGIIKKNVKAIPEVDSYETTYFWNSLNILFYYTIFTLDFTFFILLLFFLFFFEFLFDFFFEFLDFFFDFLFVFDLLF